MQFDDRLATVLRMQAGSERAAHTQFRQLLDLAGSAPAGTDAAQMGRAFERLEELAGNLPALQRAAMIREPGMRLRNPALIAWLAGQDLPIASAAMAKARLNAEQWAVLIPELTIPARALLRHRKDLPLPTLELLARLGVNDLVLPQPEAGVEETKAEVAAEAELPDEPVFELDPALQLDSEDERTGIGALVRRIEAFQRARQETAIPRNDAPRLPLGEQADEQAPRARRSVDFSTDTDGRIVWADPELAPMLVGVALASQQPEAPARSDAHTIAAMRSRQPVRSGHLVLEGAPSVAGEWRIDAAPHFAAPTGRFEGYRGRLRRPADEAALPDTPAAADSQGDRMRQIIHELRTPVNAIQGFAEIIQQQLFGPTPNEYRALAASIAGDAARMLAGFDELDRLVKLESGALELEEGVTDLAPIIAGTTRQLDDVLHARSAGLELEASGTPCPVPLAQNEADMLIWRLLATLAGSVSPGEALHIALSQDGEQASLHMELPASLAGRGDVFDAGAPVKSQAVTAGMFGAGFTLRLARAEARAAGGVLEQADDRMELRLPLARGNDAHDAVDDMVYNESAVGTG